MRSGMFVLWLIPLLTACAAAEPEPDRVAQGQQAQQAQQGQPPQQVQQIVVHDYALDSITGSHLKRRRGESAMNGQTVSREDWQRRPGPCSSNCM